MKTPVFVGSSVAIVTPFTGDFVDFERLGELIEFQISNNTNAITICGTTGEASTQTIPEHLATIEYCIKKVDGRVPVIAGTGSNDTNHALLMSQAAEESGADALLLVTPYYNKTTQAGLVKHFTYLADRVHIPIILYNVPARTGMSFTAQTYRELSRHPLINGVKEASGNLTLLAQTRALCGDELCVWSGNDDQIVPLLAMGGQGVISVLANIAPRETSDICRLWREGKTAESAALQIRLQELIDALFCEVNPIPVKTAMRLIGYDCGPLRMPLCEMDPKHLDLLKEAMTGAGLLTA
ncbi:MAG: 4-hydroxy-tetrahydrodipicolinate synthase [Oscillospiraceae bacterium]|jgi:4-hydroxy-tetrahydrodipicolinate synthase|nr:4-hydroxy-tetrahydrodipicolinate synthase [Oscillospiraceae bacterium]